MQTKIDIKPIAYIYIVLLVFLIPLKWLFAWLFATVFHEVCHWLAVKLCGGEIYSLTVGLDGAKMECGLMSNSKKLLSILCGPFGGLILVLLGQWMPQVALCSWFLSMYNLLPLLPLDGGRVLEILLGQKARMFQRIFLLLLTFGALYALVILRFGFLPLAIVAVLWVKNRNTPCKAGACKVQ